jgi:hypothetical protein
MSPQPLSSLVVGLLGAKPAAQPTDEERNVLLWSRGGDTKTLAASEGPLALGQGGIVHEADLRPRVCAFLGPGATMRGVAAIVKPIVDRATGTGPALDLPTFAAALLAYNTDYLEPPALASWHVGLRVTLPIEIDLGPDLANNPTLTGLITNRTSLADMAKLVPAASLGALNTPAAELALPDAEALPTAVSARIAAATPSDIAIELFARWMANPYDVVFEFVELVRQLRKAGTALEFALKLFGLAGREQLFDAGHDDRRSGHTPGCLAGAR